MFTPVRIRGKKPRVKRPSPENTTRQVVRSTSSLGETTHTDTRPDQSDIPDPQLSVLSALERLPIELLQKIFVLCRNLNLPKASFYIGTTLASSHLKEKLVLDAFGDCVLPSENDVDRAEHAEVQSALLRQKWLTYGLFRRCQRKYMLESAVRLYHQNASCIPIGTRTSTIALMTKFFDEEFHADARYRRQIKQWFDGVTALVVTWPEFGWVDANEGHIHIQLMHNGCHLRVSVKEKRAGRIKVVGNLWWPGSLECHIPEKLLHGPWTNEKGHFLSLMYESGAKVDWINSTGGEVAQTGLADAIREDNLCAIDLLVKTEEDVLVYYKTLLHHCRDYLGYEHSKVSEDWITELLKPQNPWKFGPSNLRRSGTLGVPVNTGHLKIAVLEKGCNQAIVNGLTAHVDGALIDCDDKELLKWAGERIEDAEKEIRSQEAGEPNLGRFLLEVLSKVREGQLRRSQRGTNYWRG